MFSKGVDAFWSIVPGRINYITYWIHFHLFRGVGCESASKFDPPCRNLMIQLHDQSVDPGDRQIGCLQITTETPVFVLSQPGKLLDFPEVCFHRHGSIIDGAFR